MRVSILIFCFLVVIGCYLAAVNASSDENCPSSERLVECCNNAPRGSATDATATNNMQSYIRAMNKKEGETNEIKREKRGRWSWKHLTKKQRCRKQLKKCLKRDGRRCWRRFKKCIKRSKGLFRRLVRLAHRRRTNKRGCCCRDSKESRRSENTNSNNNNDDNDVDVDEVDQAEGETIDEETNEENEEKGNTDTSTSLCSDLEALGNSTVPDSLTKKVKTKLEEYVSEINAADDKTEAISLVTTFQYYMDLTKCIKEKGISLNTKDDLKDIFSQFEFPKLTLELFGNPQSYDEEMEFILENIDDSVFGNKAYFCQEDKCEKYGKGKADSNFKGKVELFVPPNVKVKGSKRTYLPTAAYTLDKQDGDKFNVEEGEKDTPKVMVNFEKESYSLAKDEKVSDLKKPSQICVSKKVKAELKSKGGELWTLHGENCATSVDKVTNIEVETSDEDDEDMYVFDISKEGTALPLQMKEFNNQKNEVLLEKYKKFLGVSDDEILAIQYAKFPKDEAICFGNGSIRQETNEVPTNPPLDVVKCKESGNDKNEEEKKKDEVKKGEKKHRINRNKNRYWRKQQVMNE